MAVRRNKLCDIFPEMKNVTDIRRRARDSNPFEVQRRINFISRKFMNFRFTHSTTRRISAGRNSHSEFTIERVITPTNSQVDTFQFQGRD